MQLTIIPREPSVLLAENRYKKKQRNLALMKFSTYFKNQGYNVDYNGQGVKTKLKDHYDYIIYSTVFTYHFFADIDAIKWYQENYPGSKIMVGGVSATLLVDKFYDYTGICPHQGLYSEVECLKPDYNLFPGHKMENMSQVFTSRGCKNNCGFCAVKKLEPSYHINYKWRNSIDLDKPCVMVHDNNLTAGDINHFQDLMSYLKEKKLSVVFDNGFDCRFFNDEHLECIRDVKFQSSGLRFAFDSMNQDGKIQKAIKKCLDAGISGSKIMVYVLFNFKDTFDEAWYRADQIRQLGARPYPQQYRPLDDVVRQNGHVSEHWDKDLLQNFRYYWMMPGIYSKYTWDEYLKAGGKQMGEQCRKGV